MLMKRLYDNYMANTSLRSILMTALIVVTSVSIGFSAISTLNRINKVNWENMEGVSERIAHQLESTFNRYIANYAFLQRSLWKVIDSGTRSDPAAVDASISSLIRAYEGIESIVVFDQNGRILHSAAANYSKLLPEATVPVQYYYSLYPSSAFHAPTVLNLFENQHEWVIPYVTVHNRFGPGDSSYIMMNIRQSTLKEVLDEPLIGKNGYAYLINETDTIITHPRHQYLIWGLEQDDTLALVDGKTEGTLQDKVDGQRRFIIIRSVDGANWRLVLVAYGNDILLPWQDVYSDILLLLLISVIVMTLFSIWISHTLSRPISNLEQSMRLLQDGHLDRDMEPQGFYEAREMAKTFNQMRTRIKALLIKVQNEEKEKKRQELYALKMQIQPHFLYNTLESITWMIENEHPDEAVQMISSLSRLFRISLRTDEELIPIETELDYVRSYLEIQQLRFDDSMTYSIDLADSARHCLIIKFILQPIVENAINHGIYSLNETGLVQISAWGEDGLLKVRIADNGVGMEASAIESIFTREPRPQSAEFSGVGLVNIHSRIRLLYENDDRCGVFLQSEPDVGTEVTVAVPLIRSAHDETV